MARKLSYTHDLENFARYCIARQMFYTDDFETHRISTIEISLARKMSYSIDAPVLVLKLTWKSVTL